MKKRSRIKFVYARYILPPILMLLTFLSMLIPSYRYVTNGTLGEAVSALKLIVDNFASSRQVVFATTAQDAVHLLFSRTAMMLIMAFCLLFLLSFAVSVYSCVVALRYFSSDDEPAKEKSRTLFVTFVPNRIVLCVLYALCIPITLFPYILPALCDKIYSQYIGMALVAPDALTVACISVLAMVALCIVSAFPERALDIDLFKKRKAFEGSEDEERAVDESEESSSSEQNEMVRRILLGKENIEENTQINEKTED